MKNTYGTISGIPITGYCRVKATDIFLPMIETDTDIQWVEGCIKDREQHPEKYQDEDIPAVIAQQKALLDKLRKEAQERAEMGCPDRATHQIVIELGVDNGWRMEDEI